MERSFTSVGVEEAGCLKMVIFSLKMNPVDTALTNLVIRNRYNLGQI